MVRVVDYESRGKEILRKTIEYYLETAQPVSSEALLDNFSLSFSSATIRNVLKDLEEKGYLTHPHTSAGRIPTDKGYRFYINDLMEKVELLEQEKNTLENFFKSYLETESDVFINASRIISNSTHYIGIVNEGGKNKLSYYGVNFLLEQPEFGNIKSIKSILKLLDENTLIELMNHKMSGDIDILIGEEYDCPEMNECALIITECKTPKENLGRLAVLGPKRMAYSRVIPIMSYLNELILEEFD